MESTRKFRQSLPGVVTGSYLATVLNMAENSANANVLPFLKTLGIIDDEGKTTERARLWRDDHQYPKVCSDILKDVYPKELLDAVPNPTKDRAAAQRWFAHQSGAGEGAVSRMAALYSVLVEADASKQNQEKPRETANQRRRKRNKPNSNRLSSHLLTRFLIQRLPILLLCQGFTSILRFTSPLMLQQIKSI